MQLSYVLSVHIFGEDNENVRNIDKTWIPNKNEIILSYKPDNDNEIIDKKLNLVKTNILSRRNEWFQLDVTNRRSFFVPN